MVGRGPRSSLFALGLVFTFATFSSTGSAQVVNGSFEDNSGSYSGWGTAGNTTIQSAALGSGPTHGLFDALLATATDGTGGVPAGNGASPSALESFLGLASGSLLAVGNGTPIMGSAILQSVNLSAGERLQFDWNFLTNQTYNDGTAQSLPPSLDNNDFAFVLIRPQGGSANLAVLADTFYGFVNDPGAPGGFQTGFTITAPANPFISETGFSTWSLTASQSGSIELAMGVLHASAGIDNGVNSALLVDNVRIVAVPEPASVAILAIGSLLAVARRRGQNR